MAPLLEERLTRYLDLIRSKVVEMGARAELAAEASLKALTEGNRRLAYSIILNDQRIDDLEKEVDRLCLEFMARHQPIAKHLRFAYAVIKINTALERVGDYAESIARQVLFLEPGESILLQNRFVELGKLSIKMLHDSMQAFVNEDVELARSTISLEEKTDDIRGQIRKDLLNLHRDGKVRMEVVAALLITSSRFERVADQASNICEEVLYMCTGEMVKHRDASGYRVLFVSKNNGVRSQMAEGIANSLGLDQFLFASAGVTPRLIDAHTLKFMAGKGIDISGQNSKSLDQIPNLEHYQAIIFLSKDAAKAIQHLPAKAITLAWYVPDPSKVEGTPEEVDAAYEGVFQYLDSNIRDFVEAVLSQDQYH